MRISRDSRTVSLGRRRIGTSRTSNTSLVEMRSTPSPPTRPLSLRRRAVQGCLLWTCEPAPHHHAAPARRSGVGESWTVRWTWGETAVPLGWPKPCGFHEGDLTRSPHSLGQPICPLRVIGAPPPLEPPLIFWAHPYSFGAISQCWPEIEILLQSLPIKRKGRVRR